MKNPAYSNGAKMMKDGNEGKCSYGKTPKNGIAFINRYVNGTADDNYLLGTMYEKGERNVRKNLITAAALYIRAKNMGSKMAKKVFYFSFDEKHKMRVPKDRFEVIREAALMGDVDAQYSIAGRYRAGIDVEKDYDLAFGWMDTAHRNGCLDATYYLGTMYRKGRGVEPDIVMSLSLLEIAASRHHPVALHEIGKMYENGNMIGQDRSAAFQYFLESAESGYHMSQYHVGELYRDGIGVEKDGEKAVYWFTKAAKNSYNISWFTLGQMYEKGKAVDVDLEKALKYYQISSRLEYYPALWGAGRLTEMLTGDKIKARDYYFRALSNCPSTAKQALRSEIDRIDRELGTM